MIQEYGWRGSFLFNGALSLQIMVLGALVFPLQLTPSQEFLKDLQEQTEKFPGSIATVRGMTTSRSRVFFEKSLNDRLVRRLFTVLLRQLWMIYVYKHDG